ncbi:MAG: hypothetical protein ACRC62_17170 [Microcoleus sp.]
MPKKYIPVEVYYEKAVTLEVQVPIEFDDFDTAKNFAYSGSSLYLLPKDDSGNVNLVLKRKEKGWVILRENVEIYVEEGFYKRRPLDPKDPVDHKMIMDVLDDPNSPYMITEDDLTLVNWSFDQLADIVGAPTKFSSLAWEVIEVD